MRRTSPIRLNSSLSPVRKSTKSKKTGLPFLGTTQPARQSLTPVRQDRQKAMTMPRPTKASQAVSAFLKMARRYDHDGPLTMRNFRRIEKVEVETGTKFVADWIHDYMENIYAQEAALKIQTAFRVARRKRLWRRVLRHLNHTRLYRMRRVLIGWCGASTDNHVLLVSCFQKFVKLFHERPWMSPKQTLSPPGLFYLSGRYFYPKSYDAHQFYGICRVLAYALGRRLLRMWRRVAHSRATMRICNRRTLFTIAKRRCFGPVFYAFVLWHRLVKWKKMTADGKGSCVLTFGENIIDWNIIQRRKNKKLEMESRAAKHSLERIKKNAYHAVYQMYLDGKQSNNDFAASTQFYHRHIQEKCKQAWLTFMVLERKRRAYLSKMSKAWYQVAYRNVKVRRISTVLERTSKVARLSNLFSAWRVEARNQKVLNIAHSLNIQENRSTAYFTLFVWLKMDDEFSMFRIFREWIALTRRRRAWLLFAKHSHDIDPEQEFKQCVFHAMQRAAHHRLIRKFVQPSHVFFPHQIPYSFDAMVKWIAESRKLTSSCDSSQWKFVTEAQSNYMNETLLCRSLILALHGKHKFLHIDISPVKTSRKNIEDPVLYELDELSRAMESNRMILRRTFRTKVMRDVSLLSMLDSHTSAIQFEKAYPFFTTSVVETDMYGYPSSGDVRPLELVFFENIDVTVEECIAMNNASWKLDTRAWKGMRSAVDEFVKSFRMPSEIPELECFSPDETKDPNQQGKTADVEGPSEVVEYRPPELTKLESFPLANPVISEVKSLQTSYNMQDRGLANLLKEKPPSHFEAFATSTRLRSFTTDEILQSIRRFFLNMTGEKFDFSNVEAYGPQILDSFPQERRHTLRRRINTFILELDDRDDEKQVSVSVSSSPDAQGVISAVITAFREIKRNPVTGEYCDQVPFSKDHRLGSPELMSVQETIKKACYNNFPRLAREARRAMTSSRRRKVSSKKESDEFSNDDVMVSASILPFIMNSDVIFDFLRTEVIVTQKLGIRRDKSLFGNDSSAVFDMESSMASLGLASDSSVFFFDPSLQ